MNRIMAAAFAVAALAACSKPADTANTATTVDTTPPPASTDAGNTTSDRANPAIAPDQSRQADAPAAGHNSFTEAQAREHLVGPGGRRLPGFHHRAIGGAEPTISVKTIHQ